MSVKVESLTETDSIVKTAVSSVIEGSQVKVVTAEEIGAEMIVGASVAVPSEIKEKVDAWVDDYKSFLASRIDYYIEKRTALNRKSNGHRPGIEAGEPVVGNYVGWDLISFSPIQVIGLPPYEPSKIIAGGELAFLVAALFINPLPDVTSGFAIPPSVQLGNRNFRVSFDRLNLTNAAAEPSFVFTGAFGPAPVPNLIFFIVPIIAPAVADPQLVEVNVTADIVDLGQPYAAFATWHFDVDREPSFLGLPNIPPQFEHDVPQRYLVYPK